MWTGTYFLRTDIFLKQVLKHVQKTTYTYIQVRTLKYTHTQAGGVAQIAYGNTAIFYSMVRRHRQRRRRPVLSALQSVWEQML